MLTTGAFLCGVAENAARIRVYRLGGDGTNGESDCIGLIVGAVRLCGEAWPGIQGTNYTARKLTRGLAAVTRDSVPGLGMLVFKARLPGEAGYDLPDRYQNSEDRTDYYHVGVITALSPLTITECTGVPGAILRTHTLDGWQYIGALSLAEGGNVEMYTARVYAENGKPVRLRALPSTDSKILAELPVGTAVTVLEELTDWCYLRCADGKTGYMMSSFLRRADSAAEAVAAARALLAEAQQKLREADARLSSIL